MAVAVTHTTPADGTFSLTGSTAWDAAHSVTGLGTMATQNANAVAITGGTIDGVAITSSSAALTTLTVGGNALGTMAYQNANAVAITGGTISGVTITGMGDVVGPGSATDSHFAQFDGATGKLIKGGLALDADGTLAANSDTRLATQKAVKTYITAHAGVGDVVGPASSTDGHFATYDGATGKLLKDTLALDIDGTLAANSDTRVATQKAVKTYVTAHAGTGDVVGPGSATDGALVAFDSTTGKLIKAAAAQPYELGGSYSGVPTASAVLLRAPMCRTVSFAAGLSPSHGVAGTAATAQTDFDILKNGVSFGTMRFAAAGTVASFISSGGSTPAAGDVITVVAPASPDATLANVGFILAGTR